jgi:YidC/Oxa1 family membrane protein insertase
MEKDSTLVEPRRLLLAFVLSLALIAVWVKFFPQAETPKPLPSPKASSAAGRPDAPASPSAPAGGSAPADAPLAAQSSVPAIAASAEESVTLEGPGLTAVLSNRGAQVHSVIVPQSSKPGAPTLEMVRQRARAPYPFGLTDSRRQPSALNDVLFTVEKGGNGRSATFRYSGREGIAEKTFRVDDKGLLQADIHVAGSGWGLILGPGVRNPKAEEAESRFEVRQAVYDRAGEVDRLSPDKDQGMREIAGNLRWIGLEDHYFLAAALVGDDLARALVAPRLVVPGTGGKPVFERVPPKDDLTPEQKKLKREYLLILEPVRDRLKVSTFWGAKELERLSSLPGHLDGSVQLTVGILARPLLAGLRWIHDHVVPNYGWAIILMTFLIKLVLLPVTHQSTVSMRKMQELSPKIQAIRDRYKGKMRDKQGRPNVEIQRKMQEETMAVYRSAGVNPASGCFPILLQMPVFFAFYSVLSSAVELRGAPWMLWIQDLSVAEPHFIKVLPLVMGITQFIQVRMGPQATDPMQRRLFQLMPIMMTFVLWGFPAGLALYWLTNNVLTIAQLAVYKRLQEKKG